MTANNFDTLHEICDEVVLIASMEHLNEGNVISPQYPILTIIDIIYSCFIGNDEEVKEILHDNTVLALDTKKMKQQI